MYCDNCGEKLSKGETFCPKCGVQLNTERRTAINSRNMWIVICSSLILAIAVGLLLFVFFSNKGSSDTKKTTETEKTIFRVVSPTDSVSENSKQLENVNTADTATEVTFSITQSELEAEIEKIQTYYYTPGADDKKVVIENGTDGWDYSRDYRYHNGRLVFAFIYDGTEEHRLYFKDNHMIRYIDENHTVYDYPDTESFQSWADKAIKESYILIDDDSNDVTTDWLGTWTADTGESLEIYSVSETGISLVFHKYSEQGNMMHVDYEMEYDNTERTVVSEVGGPEDHGGWEYTFILYDEYINVKSRYPDQNYYR